MVVFVLFISCVYFRCELVNHNCGFMKGLWECRVTFFHKNTYCDEECHESLWLPMYVEYGSTKPTIDCLCEDSPYSKVRLVTKSFSWTNLRFVILVFILCI